MKAPLSSESQAARAARIISLAKPRMVTVCAWCHKWLHSDLCEPRDAGKVSRGICPKGTECYRKAMAR